MWRVERERGLARRGVALHGCPEGPSAAAEAPTGSAAFGRSRSRRARAPSGSPGAGHDVTQPSPVSQPKSEGREYKEARAAPARAKADGASSAFPLAVGAG